MGLDSACYSTRHCAVISLPLTACQDVDAKRAWDLLLDACRRSKDETKLVGSAEKMDHEGVADAVL